MNSTGNYIQYLVCVCAQLCPTLCDPMDCSPPGSSAHGIFQGRTLEWVAISFSRGQYLVPIIEKNLIKIMHVKLDHCATHLKLT